MPSFSFSTPSARPVNLQAAPLRADGRTAGTFPTPLTWSLTPNDGSIGTLNVPSTFAGNPNQDKAVFTPKAGSSGVATIAVSGQDENGGDVSTSGSVTVTTDANPTSSYVVTAS